MELGVEIPMSNPTGWTKNFRFVFCKHKQNISERKDKPNRKNPENATRARCARAARAFLYFKVIKYPTFWKK